MQRASQIMRMTTELNKSRTTLTCLRGDEFFKMEQGCSLLMRKMNQIEKKSSVDADESSIV